MALSSWAPFCCRTRDRGRGRQDLWQRGPSARSPIGWRSDESDSLSDYQSAGGDFMQPMGGVWSGLRLRLRLRLGLGLGSARLGSAPLTSQPACLIPTATTQPLGFFSSNFFLRYHAALFPESFPSHPVPSHPIYAVQRVESVPF